MYTLPIPLGTPYPMPLGAVTAEHAVARCSQNDAPAMLLRLFLISHERTQIPAVKPVVIYDAEVYKTSYPRGWTNKEETFLYVH